MPGGSTLVPATAPEGVLAPTGVVPFALSRTEAHDAFLAWLHAKEVTPESVTNVNSAESLTSAYVPWWAVTARATTQYDGKREAAKLIGYRDDDRQQEIHTWTWVEAAGTVVRDVERAIGGDGAEITTQRTSWTDVRLALVLTPVWMLTFVHEGETWNVAVDGRTGAVNGRFPLDNIKVAKAIASCFAQLVLAGAIAAAAMWAWIKFF